VSEQDTSKEIVHPFDVLRELREVAIRAGRPVTISAGNITSVLAAVEVLQNARPSHEPPDVLEKQRDHWRKQCRDLNDILRNIGECISGHDGYVFDDVHALLEQSQALKAPESTLPPGAEAEDAARYRWLKQHLHVANNNPRNWAIAVKSLSMDFDAAIDAERSALTKGGE
jgi:hypothetical protein